MDTIFDCPNPGVTCPGTDYPVSNYSSEADDGPEFVSMRWPGSGFRISGSGSFSGSGGPPLGSDPGAWPCVGMANSFVSQDDADSCAFLTSETCGTSMGDCPPPIGFPVVDPTVNPSVPGRQLFFNHAQSCTAKCDTGSSFTYTIKAGVVANVSQATADQIAESMVCQFANSRKVCLVPARRRPGHQPYDPLHLVGDNGFCCAGQLLTTDPVFEVTGTGEWTFSLADGQLPIGTGLLQDSATTCAMAGTLDVPGIYNFTIKAENSFGQSVQQDYTIHLIGLQSPSLGDGTVGDPYTGQVVALGVALPVTIVPLGPLPPGLSMSSSGALSGTPTTPGTY
jgi:hypothetical protein